MFVRAARKRFFSVKVSCSIFEMKCGIWSTFVLLMAYFRSICSMRRLLLFTSFLFSTLGDQNQHCRHTSGTSLQLLFGIVLLFFPSLYLKSQDNKCGVTFTIRDHIPNIVNRKRMFKINNCLYPWLDIACGKINYL